MDELKQIFDELSTLPSDINEHFPTMLKYGSECETITEMGVRGVISTWAWLYCKPKKLTCYDMYNPTNWGGDINIVYDMANKYDLNFEFNQADVLKIEIEETDLLFIDTWHTYDQLKLELKLHSDKVKKYICFHDTTLYESTNETLSNPNTWVGDISGQGLWPVIEEFLVENKDTWVLVKRFINNNGFTIIKRI